MVDKLGYGGYSTIWLARDLKAAKNVAVKVITADTSDDPTESILMKDLYDAPSKPGKGTIPTVVEEFWVTGPNGKHRCVVTAAAQMSLHDAREASIHGLFQPKVAQSTVAQLVRGVAFLHSNNIVHGGERPCSCIQLITWLTLFLDLHLGNILVGFPKAIDSLSTSELYEKFGEPQSVPVIRVDGQPLQDTMPTKVYIPGWFGDPSNELILGQEKIMISDFGVFQSAKTVQTLPLFQPPETRFWDESLSFSSDIWTLVCTIWEILGHRPLFEAYFASADRVTKEQVEVLGKLPLEWWENWSKRLDWFNEEGELKLSPEASGFQDVVRRTWDVRFEHNIQKSRIEAGPEVMTDEEKRGFEAMLKSMLKFQPKERATAQQVMQSEWMLDWGLLALEESRRVSGSAEN